MNLNLPSRIALALLAVGSIQQAQTPTKQAPKVAEATLMVEPELPLRFKVAGLTKENVMGIKTALTELTIQAYVCDACKVEQASTGQCPKCSAALQMAKKPLLVAVMPSPEEGSLTLTLNQRRLVRLSEIEATLKKNAVTIDYAGLPLPGRLILVVKGGTADKLTMVEKALMEAKFDEVHATFDAATNEMRFAVHSKATPPPTRASLAKTLEAQQLQLIDVFFGRVREKG